MAKSKKSKAGRVINARGKFEKAVTSAEQVLKIKYFGGMFYLFDAGAQGNTASGGNTYAALTLFTFRACKGTRRALFGVEVQLTPVVQQVGWHFLWFRKGFIRRDGKWLTTKGW